MYRLPQQLSLYWFATIRTSHVCSSITSHASLYWRPSWYWPSHLTRSVAPARKKVADHWQRNSAIKQSLTEAASMIHSDVENITILVKKKKIHCDLRSITWDYIHFSLKLCSFWTPLYWMLWWFRRHLCSVLNFSQPSQHLYVYMALLLFDNCRNQIRLENSNSSEHSYPIQSE